MENIKEHKEILKDNSYCRCIYYREFNSEAWCNIGFKKGECPADFASAFYKKQTD